MENLLYFIGGYMLAVITGCVVLIPLWKQLLRAEDFMMAAKNNAAYTITKKIESAIEEKSDTEKDNEHWNIYASVINTGEVDDSYINMYGEKEFVNNE